MIVCTKCESAMTVVSLNEFLFQEGADKKIVAVWNAQRHRCPTCKMDVLAYLRQNRTNPTPHEISRITKDYTFSYFRIRV